MTSYDLVLARGRVIDPETGLDAVRDVGITGGVIRAVSGRPLAGTTRVDVSGLVVSPGFIDLHSHSMDVAGHRLQALDGVTTVLELEAGAYPVAAAYRRAEIEGRPLNYGFATSWAVARMAVLLGLETGGGLDDFLANVGREEWQRAATQGAVDAIVGMLERDLSDGALGIGILVGYAPRIDPSEYLAVAALAARAGLPTYTHARELVEMDPGTPIDGAEEIVRAAAETGAHMHYCHVNSTSIRHVDRVLGLVEKVRAEGSRVTTEAYPYGAGMTGVGAAFLAPELLHRRGLTPHSIGLLGAEGRIADAETLRGVRETEPGSAAFVHLLDEDDPAEFAFIQRALTFTDAAVATDAVPLLWRSGTPDPLSWPLARDAVTHPRTAGTYGRTLRRLVRENGVMSLAEAVRRCTLVPADVVGSGVPAMRRKGRVQVGCDADLTVFDPETVSDRATYTETARPSAGFVHVLVGGDFVVRDEHLLPAAMPGRPVRS
ncbi:amidohydrolase family protein [Nonomuraea sp. NBC_01738]|uniref:amidohydrolase family protein n=1 Tax=Nonomuraea sp. NBC_01738 TaxID=2976003 RepID=UPI002E0D9974|nr:amidohydrolase family protein [Nonomuraea sp. NBC_01738]